MAENEVKKDFIMLDRGVKKVPKENIVNMKPGLPPQRRVVRVEEASEALPLTNNVFQPLPEDRFPDFVQACKDTGFTLEKY